MYQVAVIFVHATENSFSKLVHSDCNNVSETVFENVTTGWCSGGCSQGENASKCRAMVLCGCWSSSCLNETQLDGCPGPAWYWNF